jgi:hypothetical protein
MKNICDLAFATAEKTQFERARRKQTPPFFHFLVFSLSRYRIEEGMENIFIRVTKKFIGFKVLEEVLRT